jgi:hypothetical protein
MFPKSCNIHNIIDTFNKEFMKLITSNIVACVQFSASNCRDTEKGKENECQMSKF